VSLGEVLRSAPGVCSWAPGKLDVFVFGADDALWHKWHDGGWSGWESLGGESLLILSGPGTTAGLWGYARIDAFVQSRDGVAWSRFTP
jgi:hypothetical protein